MPNPVKAKGIYQNDAIEVLADLSEQLNRIKDQAAILEDQLKKASTGHPSGQRLILEVSLKADSLIKQKKRLDEEYEEQERKLIQLLGSNE